MFWEGFCGEAAAKPLSDGVTPAPEGGGNANEVFIRHGVAPQHGRLC